MFVQSQIVSSVIERPRIAELLAPKALVQVRSRMLTQHAVSCKRIGSSTLSETHCLTMQSNHL